MELLRDFKKLGKNDANLAGGKGASLGEMTQVDIPVPSGFVVLANAFERFLEETDLNVEIDSILDSVKHDQISTVENASEKIKTLVLQAEMPKDIEKEIQNYFKNLDAKYVAVRSSATAEDGADHAWAGQLESFLNTEETDLLDKVKHCWASLFTPRAIFYRFEKDLHKTKISVAVVVQKMVESEKSGIAFSVHPITQDRNQLIIEAGFGLGEAIVSGQITPDSYVVEKEPRKIIDTNISIQARGLYRSENGGNEWRDITKEQGEKQVLNEKEILELSEIILKIESHYGFPCDIEWAFEDGKFYIVQSRPITTIGEGGKVGIVSKFKNSIKGKQMEKWEGNFSLLLLGTGIGGCLYPYSQKYDFDFGQWMFVVNGKHGVAFVDFGKYVDTTLNAYKKFVAQKGKLKELSDFEELWKQADISYISNSPTNLKKISDQELVEQIKKAFELMRGIIGSTVFVESLDESQIKTHFQQIDNKGDFEVFFKNVSMPAFDSFALRADESILQNSNSPELQYIFTDYYLAPHITEVGKKIEELISERGGLDKIKEEAKKIKKEIEENKKVVDKFRSSLNDKLASLFDFAQICMYTRDIRKNPLQKAQTVISNTMREFFERKGRDSENAAFALYDDFVSDKYQQTEYPKEIEKRSEQGTAVLLSDKEILFEYGDTEEKLQSIFKAMGIGNASQLTGNVAYRGNVKGIVRIVLSENDFPKFNKGEILVTSMTRPEFVPLMKKAIAVITDEGGITCHAAIVSRELKIPCIIGTKVATRTLKDGDEVEIDGDSGMIIVLKNE